MALTDRNVKIAIKNLWGTVNNISVSCGPIIDMKNFAALKTMTAANTVLTSGDSDSLQTAVTNAADGDIIEVKTSTTYNPITLPVDKGITIRAAFGYTPSISGQHAIIIPDGGRDTVISGFSFPGCSTVNSNWKGSAVALEHQGIFENIILHRCAFPVVTNGSAILISYHQSIDGDNYAITPTYPNDFSSKFGVIDCNFFHACKDGTEGAAIACRAVEYLYVAGCRVNGNAVNSRGIQAQNCKNIVIDNNRLHNFGTGNSEAIKLDRIGSGTDLTTGMIINNVCYDCTEGIDIDDYAAAFIQNNLIYSCGAEGISIDGDGSMAFIIGNVVHNCVDGIMAESGAITVLSDNHSFNNSSNDYKMDNGYSPDSSNLSTAPNLGPAAAMAFYAPGVATNWDSVPNNIKDGLDELVARVKALEGV